MPISCAKTSSHTIASETCQINGHCLAYEAKRAAFAKIDKKAAEQLSDAGQVHKERARTIQREALRLREERLRNLVPRLHARQRSLRNMPPIPHKAPKRSAAEANLDSCDETTSVVEAAPVVEVTRAKSDKQTDIRSFFK